ncbi:MAG TPA: DUF2249 domain-containing protein [Rhodanobacteraceae bacterium]
MSTSDDDTSAQTAAYTPYPFDARAIAHRFRHSAIFGALDALEAGEAMRFVNDHDPIPLLNQMRQRYGERIDVIYQQHGDGGPVVIDFVVKQ